MFWPDVIDLKLFYASPLGKYAQEVIGQRVASCWDNVKDENLLGIGFTHHYLTPYLDQAQRVLSLMPAGQGALHWPNHGRANLTFLADEAEIPLPDESMSRVLLAHAFENTEQLRHMMRELWRVLAPGGSIIAVVPNRRGVWARKPGSPFAQGSPFSASQLRTLLRDTHFTPSDCHYALFTPPYKREFILKSSKFFEAVGSRFFPVFGGVIIMEAEKQIYATSKQTVPKKTRKGVYVPASQPAMTCDNKG